VRKERRGEREREREREKGERKGEGGPEEIDAYKSTLCRSKLQLFAIMRV
jgi:hypothetical protein